MDLNSDLGEGYGAWRMGDDAALLQTVTSANIACGFHGGDPAIMQRTVRTAVERGIAIGAHVSYDDRRGFGRRHLDVPPDELAADVLYQIGALDAIARAAGGSVRYVKPHGALYNEMAADAGLASVVASAVASFDKSLLLLTLPGSRVFEAAAAAGIGCVAEGFADRAYEPDGRLVSRAQPGAVLRDPAQIAERALRMAREGTMIARDGSVLELAVDTICIHGDSPGAVEIARAVRAAFDAGGVPLAPFV